MSEQNVQEPTPGAQDPANNPIPGTGGEPVVTTDYQKQYENLQPEFTRATQDRDRYRQELEQRDQLIQGLSDDDPEIRRRAAEMLNLELLEEEAAAPPEPNPALDPLNERLTQMEQRLQTQDQARQQEASYRSYRESADGELTTMGVPKGLHEVVADAALMLAEQNGTAPDLPAALAKVEEMAEHWAQLQSVQTAVKKGWQKTKPSAAVTGPGGVQATHVPQLDSRAKRADYIAQQLAQLDADDQASA